jgi:hypothetical protein
MQPIRYHRQLGRSIYIWGIFTPRDFGVLIVALGLTMILLDSDLGILALLGGYPAYLAAFRLGRPPGHDVHLFRSLTLPRSLRPGRAEPRRPWTAEAR